MHGLFITGTDTGVGKTWVSSAIVQAARTNGLRVGAYKPVCSGSEEVDGKPRWEDVDALHAALGGEFPAERIGPQVFHTPVAPPEAAAREGRRVDKSLLTSGANWWSDRVDRLVVEGAGGWLCPLTEDSTIAELARQLEYPVLIVAANRLGTINHTLLTIEAVRQSGLPLLGVVLSNLSAEQDESNPSNAEEIARRASIPWLGTIDYGEQSLRTRSGAIAAIDWRFIAKSD